MVFSPSPAERFVIEDLEIIAKRDDWLRIRDDARFVELMRLARIANLLSLAYAPLAHTLEDQSPTARRNRFAAFTFAAALIKEALGIAEGLGRWYRDAEAYRDGFGAILKNPAIVGLRSESLEQLRNKFVFHVDRDAMQGALQAFPTGGDVRLITFPTVGPSYGETYFDGADDAVLSHFFGPASDDEYYAKLSVFMNDVSDLILRFMPAAHRLIAVGLVELGCVKRTTRRPDGPSDEAE